MANKDTAEGRELLALWEKGICPFCGVRVPDGARVGSGRKADGGFCSLACYAGYYSLELVDRARRRAGLGPGSS